MFNLALNNRRSIFDFNKIFDDFFEDNFITISEDRIKVNLLENEKEYVVEAELPGFNKEDISLEMKNDILTLSVSRNEEKENSNKYIYRERHSYNMTRRFNLENVDETKITAKLENGILKIKLPITEKVKKANKIEIL